MFVVFEFLCNSVVCFNWLRTMENIFLFVPIAVNWLASGTDGDKYVLKHCQNNYIVFVVFEFLCNSVVCFNWRRTMENIF